MAGKHVGGIQNTAFNQPGNTAQLAAWRPEFPGDKVDRAYVEGRQAGIAQGTPTPTGNPHPAGSPASNAWILGASFRASDLSTVVVQTGLWINPEEPNP